LSWASIKTIAVSLSNTLCRSDPLFLNHSVRTLQLDFPIFVINVFVCISSSNKMAAKNYRRSRHEDLYWRSTFLLYPTQCVGYRRNLDLQYKSRFNILDNLLYISVIYLVRLSSDDEFAVFCWSCVFEDM
jgi:hypothetical protein